MSEPTVAKLSGITETLSPKAQETLLQTLRPLIYEGGACSCCHHTDANKLAIADAVLKWWTENNIDDGDFT